MRIHNLSLGLARAYLVEHEAGLALVDAGSPGMEKVVLQTMQEISRQDLRIIVITHAHLDHYGSAAALRRATGAPVAVHLADASAMQRGDSPLGSPRGRGRLVKALFPLINFILHPEPVTPDLSLDDGDDLSSYGVPIKVLHTPGHTPGSCCYILADRWAFVGDLLSTTGGPHMQRYFAQDWAMIPASLNRLKALHPEKIYPGHGTDLLDGEVLQLLGSSSTQSGAGYRNA
ncbi:MAG: MBL fold metallo-hydrolase [Anaerolineales bacterium]|nr:MBL fold metallo-hydrolase [Anaerolineales bacterium]